MIMVKQFTLKINGQDFTVDTPPETPLLYVLRNDLMFNGPKFGCGLGECGACSVLVDGKVARTCVLPVGRVLGRQVTTLEGLANGEKLDPVQEAFVYEQAAQCGYCLNGMIMTTKALLMRNPAPSEAEIKQALKFNLCRCGTHVEIIKAVMRAAENSAAISKQGDIE
ncbi:(2Fe-2S)-binding protein [Neptunomonas sp.]|uniref:(2Fe-2S)-binding protein n=1 Tax=Neptunomonas sp. TaxID=1971898 RepID=UPI003568D137